MPYRVWVGNVPIDCETPEQAIELAKQVDGTSIPAKGKTAISKDAPQFYGGGEPSRWTEKRVTEFFRLIEGKQRKLIDTLLEHTEGKTDDQLCQILDVGDGRALAGVMAGIWKNAKKVGADPNDLYKKRKVSIGNKRAKEYFLTEGFRRAASQVNR
jgi:hypothetical protein